ncbi:MAG: penicillin-binding protein 2 [Kiritimatiellia bacterium]
MSMRDDSRALIRIGILTLLMMGGLLFLTAALWRIQVWKGEGYALNAREQSLRIVRIPADRGRIFDRNGICLADNSPSFSLCVFVEEFRKPGRWDYTAEAVGRQLQGVSAAIGRPVELSAVDFTNHIRRRLPLPLVAWTNLDARAMARFAENQWRFRGVEIVATPSRNYPHRTRAAHLLGFVGKAELKQGQKREYDYLLPELSGKSGLERRFDGELTGTPGRRALRVDASGFMSGILQETDPVPGRDLLLTIDARIQGMAEAALAGERGSAVVIDPQSGDVLALASSPTFDPNGFVSGISRELWSALNADDSDLPMMNRAIGSFYPPGSLFKPIVGIAGLENKLWDSDTVVPCPGYYLLGSKPIGCWNVNGHGPLSLRKAIEGSCNTYFITLGVAIGYPSIYRMAQAMGLGKRTGIELDGELGGLLPDATWKRAQYKDGWREGDTCNASIGQGFLGVTPLQMASVCATIANGGRVYRPRLIRGSRPAGSDSEPDPAPDLVRDLHWGPRTISVIRGGMRDVVNSPTGTGKNARLANVVVAAKTGTAEVGRKGEGKKHVWMMAFAPFDEPRYAVAMVIEEGVSGGSTVGPKVGKLLEAIVSEAEAHG